MKRFGQGEIHDMYAWRTDYDDLLMAELQR